MIADSLQLEVGLGLAEDDLVAEAFVDAEGAGGVVEVDAEGGLVEAEVGELAQAGRDQS